MKINAPGVLAWLGLLIGLLIAFAWGGTSLGLTAGLALTVSSALIIGMIIEGATWR